jgi:hypothetical protein
MLRYICYAPDVPAGTEEALPDGATLLYVEPEQYYAALLGELMNVQIVFLDIAFGDRVPPDRLRSVDDAIAAAFWDRYDGMLMPGRVLRTIAIAAQGPSGGLLLGELERARREIYAAATLEEANRVHTGFRVQFLLHGADRYLTDFQVSVGEVVSDFILFQRAVAEDVKRAERERKPDETRAAVLQRLDNRQELVFDKALMRILNTQAVADAIPPARRNDVREFATVREPHHLRGVFSEGGDLAGSSA